MLADTCYADAAFYRDVYGGTPDKTDDELSKALFDARLKIDTLTLNRIRDDGVTDFQSQRVKLACCYQADHIMANGPEARFSGSYSIGDLKVSGAVASHAERCGCSRRAYELLAQSGLMARGV